MKNDLTEVVFLIDRSGSMSGLETDTIGGFNAMVSKQKGEDGRAYLSTILFDDRCEVLHDRADIREIRPMTGREYYVRGSTALLDAIGSAIHHIAHVHKYARAEDRPEKTIFIITTDGMENASHHYSYDRVRSMVRHEQEKYGWEFLFLGANMDAISAAADFGIHTDRAVRYEADAAGTNLNFQAIDAAVCRVRSRKDLDAGWKADIEEDYRKRGQK